MVFSLKFNSIIKNLVKFSGPQFHNLKFICRQQSSAGASLGKNPEETFIEYEKEWPEHEKLTFIEDMKIIPDFLTADDENKILEEIEPYLKRLHYEFDHWDDAIHGFRETERKHWYPDNRLIIQKVSNVAFNGEIMPFIHILDLDEKGVIKPHVDSTRYCGSIIAGLSLLSDSVMRLVRTDETKYLQNQQGNKETDADNNSLKNDDSNYRSQPLPSPEGNFYANILLKRRSLYIMRNTARYNFTHEILSNDNSMFGNEKILKTRRISIICRNEP